ncbi:hypothetical protein [Actinoallomurus iriomotensis]|uniref:Uncharacterized protein n=1 Tax=Actinoallomurus iriomotensis TaxID=478107 RepID=A0A9W6VMU5_9ACTN|nr:hypothetical protein [Actinoallomurus iriomotensis]GLY72772.1 hypothetical protein Airi01_010390 [Actinoallomurus iriomotensis]
MSSDHDETELPLDAAFERLHADAAAGDPRAAGELGRLLCLLPQDGSLTAWSWLAPEWPAEPWLRAALASRPDDIDSAALLAGLLTQRFETGLQVHDGDSDTALQDEATALYSRILGRDPDNATAKAGLAAIQDLLEPAGTTPVSGYGFYCATWSAHSGSAGWVSLLVATDPREFRWAFDRQLRCGLDGDDDPAVFFADTEPAITVYRSGEPTRLIRLERHLGRSAERPVEWSEFTLPSLTGDLLPVGHPAQVRLGHGSERLAFYGSSVYNDY